MSQIPVKHYNKVLSDHTKSAIQRDALQNYGTAEIKYVRVDPGYGRHLHDKNCKSNCLDHCENSDLIVEIEYDSFGHRAIYGIIDHEPVLWCD